MNLSIVKAPITLATHLTAGVLAKGIGTASAILRHVLPGQTPAPKASPPGSGGAGFAPAKPRVSTEPVTQPPAPKKAPIRGATTTLADPAPATATPATKTTAKRATARPGPAKKAATKAPAGATKARKAVAKKTPAKKAAPTKPAATLDEPVAPVVEDTVVYSSGPDLT